MTDIAFTERHLTELGFKTSVLARYREPHRYYHTTAHLFDVLTKLGLDKKFDALLFLAAVYHDAVYDPRSPHNEEQSADLFVREAEQAKLKAPDIETVKQLILDTKRHEASNDLSKKLIEADLDILNRPLNQLIEYEHQIFKEFQYVDYKVYQPKRIEVLESLNKTGNLASLISYVKQRKPLIGVFCGSFNPFHKGHNNVLEKAEKIFDKVIIAFGKNTEKGQRTWEIPNSIKNRQIEEYNGLLTDFVQSLGQDVVVIRGLRNSTDFQYEQNQYRYIQELMPGIKIINIFCDKEFEHISSSGIRTLEKFGRHHNYLLD